MDEIMETDTGNPMLPPAKSGFIVVKKCKRVENQNSNCVCVPKTWTTCEMERLLVAIGYPAEDEDSIAERIRKREPADKKWQSYIGEIQFESESYEAALDYLQAIRRGSREQFGENSNEKRNEEADGHLQLHYGGNSKQIEENNNEKTNEDAVGCLQTMFGENSKQIKNNNNRKHKDDIVADIVTLLGGNGERIEDNSNQIKAVTDPKTPLKLKIKLNQKSEEKKQSEKKYHKIHSEGKVHKHRHMKQLTLTNNITKRSSPDSADTRVGTEPCMSRQSNCQSSETSSKILVSEIRNSVQSAPETHLKISNNNSYSSKKMVSESFDAEKENSNIILPEDQELVEDMYTNLMRHYMKTTALDIKTSRLIVMEHKAILDKIVAKYRIPLPPTTASEREEENLQDDEKENQDDDVLENEAQAIIDPVNEENERNDDQLEEENSRDTERETQDDDVTENEAQVSKLNDKASEENLLEERKNTEILESDSNNAASSVWMSKIIPISNDNDIQTLRHPHPAKGLIKIGRHSHFYISAVGLEKAKRISRNVKQFARELFKEVFTDRALGTGSMTGFNNRPALHHEATTVLQKFAMKHGQDESWVRIEPMELQKNLKSFLSNNRRHYPSKEAKRKV